jgi:hypothetical protein
MSFRAAARAALVVGLGSMLAGAGCGHCDGAIRQLRINSVDVCGLEECTEAGGVTRVGPDMSVRIMGDGPNDESEALLADSGIGEESFFLVDENDERVAVRVTGDAGGHSCRNGVGFNLQPEEPLAVGTYTVVLVLDDLDWSKVGRAGTQSWEGKAAFVREIEVVAADEG